ncbi:MAG: hypothetical protein GXO50_05660 [Chlorobi bacterium]|nr:hypothetical protein [Chlorobiota bacterium]
MRFYLFFLFIFLISFHTSAQRTVSGHISKTGGGAAAGAKVSAKNAPGIFTLTDEKGFYKIDIPEEVKSLYVSFSGMVSKTVKIKDFDIINITLVPAKYKTFGYGFGIASGGSGFDIYRNDYQDTSSIDTKFLSLHADLFYRINKTFEIQGIFENDFNFAKYIADSTDISGYTFKYEETTNINRFSFSMIMNFHLKLDKTGNYSFFAGVGPQFQYSSFLETSSLGIRLQTGISTNNYGKTTRFYVSADIENGDSGKNSTYIPEVPYDYLCIRAGILFIF